MLAEVGDRRRLTFDSSQCRHAVEENRDRRSIGDSGVISDKRFLSDCSAIKVWRDYQYRIRARSCSFLDLIDCPARTLLSRTNDESQTISTAGHSLSRRRDHLDVFALVEMHPFACGSEDRVAAHAGHVPLRQILA